MAGRSTLFWAGVIGASLCGVCTLGTLALGALGLLAADADDTPAAATTTGQSRIPCGNTPGLYPGMHGWLPACRGVPIPDASLDDGAPRGLWWAPRMDGARSSARVMVFLEDGRYADGPRPGGPLLVDLDGQRAGNGYTGVGTFEVSGDRITLAHDGFRSTDPFSTGEDDTSVYFAIGQLRYRPLSVPSRELVLGTWKTAGSRYTFHDDGTFELGQVAVEVNAGASHRGRWTLEGYLLMLEPPDGRGWITTIAAAGERFLVIGSVLHQRE